MRPPTSGSPPDPAPLALVTGGAGFIGSHLTDLLLERGWRVRVLDNLSSGRRENLAGHGPGLEFLAGDIRDVALLQQACSGVRAVFHLAALVSVIESIKSPARAEEINVQGTLNVFAAAAAAGVRRAVFSSSSAVYGDAPGDLQHEGLPPAPTSPYASTKLAGENLAASYGARGLSIVSLRYFNVYGPRQNPASDYAAVIPRFLDLALRGQVPTIYGDGEQSRDFIFVGDVARANLQAAEYAGPLPAPAVFNIGTGLAMSVNILWQQIAAITHAVATPRHATARAGEVRHSRADPGQARTVLGFTAASSLEQGLAVTMQALRHAAKPA